MDLKTLQNEVNARWGSQDANPCHGSDAGHALVHMTKALGKIASAFNDAEHERRTPRPDEIEKYLADIVICAARFANGVVDIDAACVARLAEKFPTHQRFYGRHGGAGFSVSPRDYCTCFHTCEKDSHSGDWHQHENDPCPVHPEAEMVG